MSIYGHDIAENGSECLKPSYFDLTEVDKLFGVGVAVRSKMAKMAKIFLIQKNTQF